MKMDDKYSKLKNKLATAKVIKKHRSVILRIILPVVIILVGGFYTIYLLKTSQKSKRQPPLRQARLVEVASIKPSDVPINISVMGTVIAAKEVDLKPQVSGKIMELSPELIPGLSKIIKETLGRHSDTLGRKCAPIFRENAKISFHIFLFVLSLYGKLG